MKSKTEPMKTKTLEDALFDTGAPDEIILLAMIEAFKQGLDVSKLDYCKIPFNMALIWNNTQQRWDFWSGISSNYQIR